MHKMTEYLQIFLQSSRRVQICKSSAKATVSEGFGLYIQNVPDSTDFYIARGQNQLNQLSRVSFGALLKNLSQEIFESGSLILLKDGVPAHTSKATQSWLQKIFRVLFLKKNGRLYSRPELYGLFCVVNSSDECVV